MSDHVVNEVTVPQAASNASKTEHFSREPPMCSKSESTTLKIIPQFSKLNLRVYKPAPTIRLHPKSKSRHCMGTHFPPNIENREIFRFGVSDIGLRTPFSLSQGFHDFPPNNASPALPN
jgi:hypothetical protein